MLPRQTKPVLDRALQGSDFVFIFYLASSRCMGELSFKLRFKFIKLSYKHSVQVRFIRCHGNKGNVRELYGHVLQYGTSPR